MAYFLQQLANAVPVAALYALLAFGYGLVFALTRRADLTFGALFAFSGQIFILFVDVGWSRLFLVMPAALGLGAVAALLYTGGAGLVIARTVMRPLAHGAATAVVVASLGVLLVLSETARLASDTRAVWLPPMLNMPVVLWSADGFPVALTVMQLLNVGVMLGLLLAGQAVLARSAAGRMWRAVAQDRQAAALCGIDPAAVFLATSLAAALVATIAGVLAAAYYGNMDFGTGFVFALKVLFIAGIGGHGEPRLAALGGGVIGLLESLWSGYGPIVWRDPVIFGLLVLMLVLFRREKPAI
ncbi:branched-chain amino acid ABC transporter permease [Rhizobium sp. SG2393]|uniref:branched-chain amino acid ABC transporter permease n=1 Tax=Rhizobium sp. SG2393 TaxID=3276279 RepID=UPI00366E6840